MATAKKLQAEIVRVMRKIDEGVELFDELWEKVHAAESSNHREKYEGELKKEIKKLQRLREQVKNWAAGNEVRDKTSLLEARRLIETKMEAFKECERETKTKTYSKAGLARNLPLDPEAEAKQRMQEWVQEQIEALSMGPGSIEELDLELEKLSANRRKRNSSEFDAVSQRLEQQRMHVRKLELILRLLDNGQLETDAIEEIKEDLEFYVETCKEVRLSEEILDGTDIYDNLNLPDVSDLTMTPTVPDAAPTAEATKRSKRERRAKDKAAKKSSKSSSLTPSIPTIGRPQAKSAAKAAKKVEEVKKRKATGPAPAPSPAPMSPPSNGITTNGNGATPGSAFPKAEPTWGATVEAAVASTPVKAAAKEEKIVPSTPPSPSPPTPVPDVKVPAPATPEKKLPPPPGLEGPPPKTPMPPPKVPTPLPTPPASPMVTASEPPPVLTPAKASPAPSPRMAPAQSAPSTPPPPAREAVRTMAELLAQSYSTVKQQAPGPDPYPPGFKPRNVILDPAPFAREFPSEPPANLLRTANERGLSVYQKMSTDTLFFVFYQHQGSFQQVAAAKELHGQGWYFHRQHKVWLKRADGPSPTDRSKGQPYVFFDYRNWVQRRGDQPLLADDLLRG